MTRYFQAFVLQLLTLTALTFAHPSPPCPSTCKPIPGSPNWPSLDAWNSLNTSLSGRLISPVPPGAVCHPGQPTFSATQCPSVQLGWLTTAFHANDPVSTDENNWNNDTCLPIPTAKCSGQGYPVYVVNASDVGDVQKGVQFAKETGVRLIVKGTGHDYLGRSVAPNSLSIWTHHLKGITIHADTFQPQGCSYSIDSPALTAMSGEQFGNINLQASLQNLTLLSGGAETVGIGGYLTGGGHAAYSNVYGLAADNVLEMQIVTPTGDIVVANECQNQDIFWAMRGGGGSTFGVLTSATMRAFPSTPFASVNLYLATTLLNTDAYWDAIAYFLSQFDSLAGQGIVGYTNLVPTLSLNTTNLTALIGDSVNISDSSLSSIFNTTANASSLVLATFSGAFVLPLIYPGNTTDSLATAIGTILTNITTTHPLTFVTGATPITDPNFQTWYARSNGPLTAGGDTVIGSRLLPPSVLAYSAKDRLINQFKIAAATGIQLNLVSGPNVWNAKPRGGGDAVNPAWRKSLIHAIVGVAWTPGDDATKKKSIWELNNVYVQALRDLAPASAGGGAYVNEADPYEPHWQQTFWGKNYKRLLGIKRKYDPDDVLVCFPCVGSEGWREKNGQLCRE